MIFTICFRSFLIAKIINCFAFSNTYRTLWIRAIIWRSTDRCVACIIAENTILRSAICFIRTILRACVLCRSYFTRISNISTTKLWCTTRLSCCRANIVIFTELRFPSTLIWILAISLFLNWTSKPLTFYRTRSRSGINIITISGICTYLGWSTYRTIISFDLTAWLLRRVSLAIEFNSKTIFSSLKALTWNCILTDLVSCLNPWARVAICTWIFVLLQWAYIISFCWNKTRDQNGKY